MHSCVCVILCTAADLDIRSIVFLWWEADRFRFTSDYHENTTATDWADAAVQTACRRMLPTVLSRFQALAHQLSSLPSNGPDSSQIINEMLITALPFDSNVTCPMLIYRSGWKATVDKPVIWRFIYHKTTWAGWSIPLRNVNRETAAAGLVHL